MSQDQIQKILCRVFVDEGQGEGELVVHEKVNDIISPKKILKVAINQVFVHDWVMRGAQALYQSFNRACFKKMLKTIHKTKTMVQ